MSSRPAPHRPTDTEPLHGIFHQVYVDICMDRAQLPSMPDLALRIRAAMSDPNCDIRQITRIVQTDPGMCAYIIRLANSAFFGSAVTIRDVGTAIARLGMDFTRNVVTAYTLRSMFNTRSYALATVMRNTWERSARLAAVAAAIAARSRGFSVDTALLAGLLQDIGVLPLLQALERRKQPAPAPDRLLATVEAFAAKTGTVLLQHWEFPQEVVQVARSRCDWMRDESPNADLADVVLVARLHANVLHPSVHNLPQLDQVPAFHKLNLGKLAEDHSLEILSEAQDEVQEITRMLGI